MTTAALAVTLAPALVGAPSTSAVAADPQPWMNTSLSPDQRAALLLSAMTLEEKADLMQTTPGNPSYSWYNNPIPRLGIPGLAMGDAASGIGTRGWTLPDTGDRATSFPQQAGVAATWNPDLALKQGRAVGLEGRLTGHDMVLGPGADIVRNPYWGRASETFSEDPELNGVLATSMIEGIESQDVMASLKHYVGYARENNRGGINSVIDERALREVYALPFEDAIAATDVASIMCSFNKVNGVYACDNEELLNDLLRTEFDFKGFVVTDTQAVKDTVNGVTAGTDMETGGGTKYGTALVTAVRAGRVSESLVDRSVLRILRTMFKFGLFEKPETETGPLPVARHRKLSGEINREAITLLKNDAVLPFKAKTKSIAVIGSDARRVTSATSAGSVAGINPVPILDGIRARAQKAGARVRYVEGNDPVGGANMVESRDMTAVPSSVLTPETGSGTGLTARHWGNTNFGGAPRITRVERQVAYDAGFVGCTGPLFGPICGWTEGGTVPVAGSNPIGGNQSATWEGFFTAPKTGTYRLGLAGYGTGAVVLDGQQIVTMSGNAVQDARSAPIQLVAGERHRLLVTMRSTNPFGIDSGVGLLQWQTPQDAFSPSIQRAAEAAEDADVAVVLVRPAEAENRDRRSLKLAQNGEAMVRAVTAANPNTVVVVASGGPVTMPWIDEAPAVVWNPYGGQEEGNALASILFGDANPSGHLPVTWPRSEDELPTGVESPYKSFFGPDDKFAEGVNVGYRGYATDGIDPLFSFGHGLSYTSFDYEKVTVGNNLRATGGNAEVDVRVRLKNTGKRLGSEVVQVYVGELPGVDSPERKLAGFAKVTVSPGRKEQVDITLNRRSFSYWNTRADEWVTPKGKVNVYVGSSAVDAELADYVRVR